MTAYGSKMQDMDLAYHMEQGTKGMHANRWIVQDNTTSIHTRLKYFNVCVSTIGLLRRWPPYPPQKTTLCT